MSATVTFSGLEELRAQLRALPERLADEASVIVQQHAQVAAASVRAVYNAHRVTGNLAEGVIVEINSYGRFGTSVKVRAKAHHTWLFENGSQARHYMTRRGKRKLVGRMPARPTFIPTMVRFRTAMYDALVVLLQQQGATVDRAA